MIDEVVKKAQKQLYLLKKLKKVKPLCQVLVNFCTAAIESIPTRSITNWDVQGPGQEFEMFDVCSFSGMFSPKALKLLTCSTAAPLI